MGITRREKIDGRVDLSQILQLSHFIEWVGEPDKVDLLTGICHWCHVLGHRFDLQLPCHWYQSEPKLSSNQHTTDQIEKPEFGKSAWWQLKRGGEAFTWDPFHKHDWSLSFSATKSRLFCWLCSLQSTGSVSVSCSFVTISSMNLNVCWTNWHLPVAALMNCPRVRGRQRFYCWQSFCEDNEGTIWVCIKNHCPGTCVYDEIVQWTLDIGQCPYLDNWATMMDWWKDLAVGPIVKISVSCITTVWLHPPLTMTALITRNHPKQTELLSQF